MLPDQRNPFFPLTTSQTQYTNLLFKHILSLYLVARDSATVPKVCFSVAKRQPWTSVRCTHTNRGWCDENKQQTAKTCSVWERERESESGEDDEVSRRIKLRQRRRLGSRWIASRTGSAKRAVEKMVIKRDKENEEVGVDERGGLTFWFLQFVQGVIERDWFYE